MLKKLLKGPDNAELFKWTRQTGLSFAGAGFLLWIFFGINPMTILFWSLGGGIIASPIVSMRLTTLLFNLFKGFGVIVSTIAMVIPYILVFLPVGLLFRLIGRDPLKIKWENDEKSYWSKKVLPDKPTRYFNQF